MQRTVAIRADGGHQVGTGHLARTFCLADRLHRSGSRVTFVSRPLDGCADVFEGLPHGLILLPLVSEGPSARAASAVRALGPNLIVNDVRDTSDEYMRALGVPTG